MPKLRDLQGDHFLVVPVAAEGTAGTAEAFTGPPAPFKCKVTAVTWVPNAAVTANGTNYATLALQNGGATGTGTTNIASRSYAATNSVARTAEALTLNATAANLNLAAGDILVVDRSVAASGVATPGGVFIATIQAR